MNQTTHQTPIQKLKTLIEGINEWGDGIEFSIVQDKDSINSMFILPTRHKVGVTENFMEYIRNLLLNRIAVNNISPITLEIVGSNSGGFKILATSKHH